MKRLTGVNVQALVLLLLSVAETVFMALFKPFDMWMIILIGIASLIGVVAIRFAYNIAHLNNRWHSIFYRKNASADADDEPSDLAIILVKISGYMVYVIPIILMFI